MSEKKRDGAAPKGVRQGERASDAVAPPILPSTERAVEQLLGRAAPKAKKQAGGRLPVKGWGQ